MRTKQSAIRRVANDSDDEGQPSANGLSIVMPQSPESGPPSDTPIMSIITAATIINGQGQQQLEDGTVVVQPEAVTETGDSGHVGCFDQASSGAARCSAPGIYDTVKCTACGKKVNPYNGTMEVHPLLKVLVCHKCYKFYASGHFDSDEQGKENQCRWCGEGGSLICCDNCEHSFCRTCIKRNLGRSALQEIESLPDDSVWLCFACDQSSLRHLQEEATIVIKAVKDHFQEVNKRSEKHKVAQAKKAVAAPISTPVMQAQPQLQPLPLPQLQQIRPGPVLVAAATPTIAYSSVRGGVGLSNSASIGGMQLDLSAVPKITSRAPSVQQPLQPHRQLVQQQNQPNLQQNRQQLQQLQLQQRRQLQQQQQQQQHVAPGVAVMGNQASVTQRTEQWYKQNVRIENILADIESVDVRSIGTALNATVSLLQGMMRQYSRFMQDFNGASTLADKTQVVARFKSAYRMHLFLRLGKLRSLIAEEDKHMMRKTGNRTGARFGAVDSSVIDLTGSSVGATADRQMQQSGLHTSQTRSAGPTQQLIQSAVPVVSRYHPHAQVVQQSQQRQSQQRQATSVSRPSQPAQVVPEMVVVLSDDDDDDAENNNKNNNSSIESENKVAAGKQSDQPEVPASAAPTATGSASGGGKPAAILELLEARRRREKCGRKLQQPRRIPTADGPAESSEPDASPEVPPPDEVSDVADDQTATVNGGVGDDAGGTTDAAASPLSERIGPTKRRPDADNDGAADSGAESNSCDSAPPSEKRPRHQQQEINADATFGEVAPPSTAAAAEASAATA